MKVFQFVQSLTACRLNSYPVVNSIAIRSISQSQNSEWTDTPEYPPIRDLSNKVRRQEKKQEWYDKISKLPTVEQKLTEMNMPKYYGYPMFVLRSTAPRLNALEFVKYITRSHIVEAIPNEYYADVEIEAEKITKAISTEVEDLISFHFGQNINRVKRGGAIIYPTKIKTGNFIREINSLVLNYLSHNEHVCQLEADVEPRIEGAWPVGGFPPRPTIVKQRENDLRCGVDPHEPVDRWMRSSVSPALSLRSSTSLPNVVPRDDSLATMDMPTEPLHPKSAGLHFEDRRAVIVPGFWPGCANEHGHLFYHSREFMKLFMLKITEPGFVKEAIDQTVLLSGFTQAHSYALYQGFTPFNEMSFPIVQQTISSDGQNFKFGVYQLNTCCLVGENATNNNYNNIMWMTEDIPLFEAIEDGKVKGFNESVVKDIVKMYLKEGESRPQNLNENGYKYLMDHKAPEEFKNEFQKSLHYIMSERPRGIEKPIMQQWERIYMVDNSGRAMDKKVRFFNSKVEQDPRTRRLDDYIPKYIPADIRTHKLINRHPKIDSENLFKHLDKQVKRARLRKDDPELKSFNQTEPRYTRRSFLKYMTIREIKESEK